LVLEAQPDEATGQHEHEQQLRAGDGLPPLPLTHQLEIAVVPLAPRFHVGVRVAHVVILCRALDVCAPGGSPPGAPSLIPIPVPTTRGDDHAGRNVAWDRAEEQTEPLASASSTHRRNRCETWRCAAKCSNVGA